MAPVKKIVQKKQADSSDNDNSSESEKKAAVKSDSSESDGGEDGDNSGEEIKAEDAGKTELFIKGLSFDTTDESLRAFFEPYGELIKCKNLRGKAFIEYSDHDSAVKAIKKTN